MDPTTLLASFQTGTYSVRRVAQGTFQHGKEVQGAVTTLTINGVVYPATGQDLMRLDEGQRSVETRVVLTPTKLEGGGIGNQFETDLVDLDSVGVVAGTGLWQVQHREAWMDPNSQQTFYRYICQRSSGEVTP